MARVLPGGGFDPARPIVGIAVNRWAHGYSHTDGGEPAYGCRQVLERRTYPFLIKGTTAT